MKTKKKTQTKAIEYEESSGNVFAALGFENPEEDLAKATLIAEISHIIKKKKLTQAQVAKILGVNQPRISSLLSGNLDLFSIDMLMNFLKILGQDIKIVIMPKPRNHKHAHLSVFSSSGRVSVPLAAKSH
jgi:predicted XRE-type DNA-binding protein